MGNCLSLRRRQKDRGRESDIRKFYAKLKTHEEQLLRGPCDDVTDSRMLRREESVFSKVHKIAMNVDPTRNEYPFKNLVFEGGGNKGIAYAGSLMCLEECGIAKNIKRVAGSSAGAITAALFALGYTADEIFYFFSERVDQVFLDHSCGYLSLLPNLVSKFGWNPGNKIYKWLGDRIKVKSKRNDPDMTFYELLKETGVELCVVVTNLNRMAAEYCHPKTTPDMPIRKALRMSMSIPVVFTAKTHNNHGQEDTYVDGGVLCNYPIHCFDGWYLSMKEEDRFLKRMQSLDKLPALMSVNNRFGIYNAETLGFLLYDDTEMEVMRYDLESRWGANEPKKPRSETKLFKDKQEKKNESINAEREHRRVVKAAEAFMKALHEHNIRDAEFIDKSELENALKDEDNFPPEQKELLFGCDTDVDTVFKILDEDNSGQIVFRELIHFIEERGIRMQTRFHGYGRRNVSGFLEYCSALQSTLLTNIKYVFVKAEDVNRTVGINTGHVGTSDYVLEEDDREFARERGYNATFTFLKYYTAHKMVDSKDRPNSTQGNGFTMFSQQEEQDEAVGEA